MAIRPDDDLIDTSLPRVPVSYKNLRGITYKWELVPMFWREPFDTLSEMRILDDDHMGRLLVHQEIPAANRGLEKHVNEYLRPALLNDRYIGYRIA